MMKEAEIATNTETLTITEEKMNIGEMIKEEVEDITKDETVLEIVEVGVEMREISI